MMRQVVAAACLAAVLTLTACTRFNTQTFLANGFGHDLRPLLIGKEFVLGDGSLLVRDVTADDEIYQRFFGADAEAAESPELVVQGLDLTIAATPQAPVLYRTFDSDESYEKIVTYQPATSEQAFLFVPKSE